MSNAIASSIEINPKDNDQNNSRLWENIAIGSLLLIPATASLELFEYDKGQNILEAIGKTSDVEQYLPSCPAPLDHKTIEEVESLVFPQKVNKLDKGKCLEVTASNKELIRFLTQFQEAAADLPMHAIPYLDSSLAYPDRYSSLTTDYKVEELQTIKKELAGMEGTPEEKYKNLLLKKFEGYAEFQEVINRNNDTMVGPVIFDLQNLFNQKLIDPFPNIKSRITAPNVDSDAAQNAEMILTAAFADNYTNRNAKEITQETITAAAKLLTWSAASIAAVAGLTLVSAPTIKKSAEYLEGLASNMAGSSRG